MFRERKSRTKFPQEVVGIDIGNKNIKMLRVKRVKDRFLILDCGLRTLPERERGFVIPAEEVEGALESLLKGKDFKKTSIYSVLPGSKVCLRVITLPQVPQEEIPQILKTYIRKHISYPLEEVVYDFKVLGQTIERGVKKLEVLFVAVQNKIISNHIDLFNNLGLEPKLLTTTSIVIWNLLHSLQILSSRPLIGISIGYLETDIVVFREEKLLFGRNIPIGGRDFTLSIKNRLNVSLQEAERLKIEQGLEEGSKIREILGEEARGLLKEINLTLQHYRQITHGEEINTCFLMGGSANLKGLKEFISTELGISAEYLELPPGLFDISLEDKGKFQNNFLLYAPSLGIALSRPEGINLISPSKKRREKAGTKPSLFSSLIKISIGVFIILAVGIFSVIKLKGFYYQSSIEAYQQKWVNLEGKSMRIMNMKKRLDILEFKARLYQRLLRENLPYPSIISDICKSIPSKNIIFQNMEFVFEEDMPRFVIKGTLSPDDKGKLDITQISNFMSSLQRKEYFRNLSVNTAPGRGRGALVDFTIKGEIDINKL